MSGLNRKTAGLKLRTFYIKFIRVNSTRGKKWYFPLVTNAVDVALVNAHAIYRRANGTILLLDYRRTVARAYLATSSPYSDPKKDGRLSLAGASSSRIPLDVRAAGNHYIGRTEEGKQRKCAVCKKMRGNNAVFAMSVFMWNALKNGIPNS